VSQQENEMNDNELNQFFAEVWMYFEESQESAKKKFGVGTFDSWNADITESKLIFENEKRRLVGEIRIIGTVTRSIWTWGWANSKLPDATSKSSEFMKQFGNPPIYHRLQKWNRTSSWAAGWIVASRSRSGEAKS
jgi:hypothetical protein